ncbi:hypothetical protein, partial [Paraburkholderia ribeironis]|uniref:hypothetical protein n=1 Tax=Paraburkholderia ribeironis TaxID=1247936 RepID=UPI001C3FEE70
QMCIRDRPQANQGKAHTTKQPKERPTPQATQEKAHTTRHTTKKATERGKKRATNKNQQHRRRRNPHGQQNHIQSKARAAGAKKSRCAGKKTTTSLRNPYQPQTDTSHHS